MITKENEAKLWRAFLEIYIPGISRTDLKKKYSHNMLGLNLPGCGPCQVNHTFNEFLFKAEDMTPDEIQNFLNPKTIDMPMKKAAKKNDTKKASKAVVKAKKAVAVVKETVKKAVESKPVISKPVKATPSLTTEKEVVKVKARDAYIHGGIKFLYIPKRK